ncbi:hypothetical protein CEXT_243051 [Caerostris extrusa]|uniref:Uncharacterized protein n=1 Tax=Caerostris extrusa TaxID=172846 RepID=A0AAV4S395_CAEEX|nr:hypothetical protein CEXT_243051 [Caerostris extrusa]
MCNYSPRHKTIKRYSITNIPKAQSPIKPRSGKPQNHKFQLLPTLPVFPKITELGIFIYPLSRYRGVWWEWNIKRTKKSRDSLEELSSIPERGNDESSYTSATGTVRSGCPIYSWTS